MANITKKALRNSSTNKYYQSWDSAVDLDDDGNAITVSDVFRITDSIYTPASNLVLTVDSGYVDIRLNPIVKVYPHRNQGEMGYVSETYNLVASGREFIDETAGTITITSAGAFELRDEIPVDTLQIVTLSGDFTLIVD